jgi:pimeloyl-ACP methyl ester carboxylesterase
MVQETPILILDEDTALYGMLRAPEGWTSIIILLPAPTGTRIGPQNIYVEIARDVAANGMACLCTELPPAGDSYDISGNSPQGVFDRYAFYLDKIHAYLLMHYKFDRIYIASISVGCLPIMHYCHQKNFSGVVLLSPNHFWNKASTVNKRNIKAYIYKSVRPETWKKVLTLKVNYKQVLYNILPAARKKKRTNPAKEPRSLYETRVLCIFGERDEALKSAQEYWKTATSQWQPGNYEEVIITGADHSFFGWDFKICVCENIVKWIQKWE